MPHYKDGTPAKPGDIVMGRGYNVKREIVGVVQHVSPGATCNLQVNHVQRISLEGLSAGQIAGILSDPGTKAVWRTVTDEAGTYLRTECDALRVDTEYGECAAFSLLSRDPNSAEHAEHVAACSAVQPDNSR